ncbi:serine/threonine protein kinase [Nocardioides sp. KIGAM211]|uniref:non-specific serine/threonine protein kinase n=1 Tax=Nocardioides luti TaxID=2761101 RepID=A0A7X0RH02_9ACTN|nr:serine/threonine-protein kinase [Nocardioides luti]MBB6628156.1 serine/threonine protein kinase [Nocardioides luti]
MSMPARLGRYAVRRRIGSGGFATVWLAYDEQLDSPVAVKVLADNWTEDHHVRQRFLEEGRYLRKVESPHVVSVYDAGELEDGRPYLVMSYADQGTLADRLEVEGLTPAQAMEVVRQVGAGLHALHQRGILHRDVKPANVLFRTVDGEVRAMVGDLGLGKALDMSSRLTMIAGTPSFVAPEQAQGEALDARADQYSLAALAFLLLAGRAPYAHASLAAAAEPGPPPSLSTDDRPFPREVEDVVRRGLAPGRDDRWPDVTAFVDALARSLGSGAQVPIAEPWMPVDPNLTQPGAAPSRRPASGDLGELGEPVPPAAAPRRRTGRVVVAALVGLAALAVGAGVGYAYEQRSETTATLTDADGNLTVTVPETWQRTVAPDGWKPPNDRGEFPALSVGTSADWTATDSSAQGVFLGILPGTELPQQVPQHPECGSAAEPVEDNLDGDAAVTVVYSSCPGGVTVERVVQVAVNRLLWVQVRSASRATANAVLDSVDTSGI